jgi:hypothetical protein
MNPYLLLVAVILANVMVIEALLRGGPILNLAH